MPRLVLYPFRFGDPLTGKWVRARHKMQVPELQRAYTEWEITGEPEVRHVMALSAEPFNPFVTTRQNSGVPPTPIVCIALVLCGVHHRLSAARRLPRAST